MELESKTVKKIITKLPVILIISVIPLLNAGFDNNVVYYLLMLLSVTIIYQMAKNKNKNFASTMRPHMWLLLFIIWGGVSFLWTASPTRTIIEVLELITGFAVFDSISNLKDDDKFRIGRIAVITGTAIAILGIIEFLFVNSQMIISTFPHHNPFGIYIAMLFLLVWGYTLKVEGRLNWAVTIILLVTLLLSASRGAIICTTLALPLIFLGQKKKDILKVILKTIVSIALSFALTFAIIKVAPYIQNKDTETGAIINSLIRTNDFQPSAVGGRLSFWRVAGNLFMNKPMQGYGLGAYYTAYYEEYEGNGWYSRYAHNHYLQTAAELGIVGLLFLVGFLLTSLLAIIRTLKSREVPVYLPAAIAACFAFVLHIGIDFSWNYPGALFIFFAILGAAVGNKGTTNASKKGIRINYGVKVGALSFVILLTVWHLSSIHIFNRAYKMSLNQELEKSNKIFEIGRKINPINQASYYLQGMNYKTMYNKTKEIQYITRSEELIKKAVKLSPYDWVYLNELGKTYITLNNKKEAEESLRKAASYSSYRVEPHLNLGILYLNQNRIEEAREVFEKGLLFEDKAFIGIWDKNEREVTATYLSLLHYYLANVYSNQGTGDVAQKHVDALNKYIKEYSVIGEYLKAMNTP